MRPIKRIIVHCAATPPSMDIGAEEIRRWHTDPKPEGRGWSDIGYHGVIRRDGMYEPGRPEYRSGAHARGHNADTLAVCLVGGVTKAGRPSNNFKPEQLMTLKHVILWWSAAYEIELEDVLGHRDLPGVAKACPSFDLRGWIRNDMPIPEVKKRAAAKGARE